MAESSVVPPSVSRLRVTATVAAVLVLIQLALGVMITVGTGGLSIRDVHAVVGYLTVIAGVVAAVFAWSAAKLAGSKGIFFHALSLPVLALIQIALAEADLRLVHIILGILTVVAFLGLVPMANKLAGRTGAAVA